MEAIAILLKQFENFIKRSLVPSSSFLMFYMIFDILYNKSSLLNFLNQKSHSILLILSMLIIFTGISTVLTILHQFFYDNQLKENFEGNYFFNYENQKLITMRNKIIENLKIQTSNDYLLYHMIGKKMKNLKKDIKTERYIDDIKAIGILFISLMIVISITAIHYINSIENFTSLKMSIFISLLFILYPIYYLGKELIKSKYRSRSIRIYTNYLDEIGKI